MPQKLLVIVDDNSEIRMALHMALQEFDLPILEFENGDRALEFLQTNTTDAIVILDQYMSGLTGQEILEIVDVSPELQRNHRFIYMTAMSAHFITQMSDVLGRLRVPLISKPFELDELLTIVGRMLPEVVPIPDTQDDQYA